MNATVAAMNMRRITYSVFQSPELRRGRPGRIIAITSANREEGVTWVAETLCRELSGDLSGRTLYCSADKLAGCAVEKMNEVGKHCARLSSGYWVLDTEPLVRHRSAWEYNPELRQARVDALRNSFDYVILDCPSVCRSGEITAIAPLSDGVLLVVAAGRSTRKQIAYAQQVIALSGGSLKGAVFNRRTYPIPSWLYKVLVGARA